MSMLIGEILDNSVREHRDVTAVQWLKKREVYDRQNPPGTAGKRDERKAYCFDRKQ